MSHRYGSRALPTRILRKEYDILQNELNKIEDIDKSFKYEYTSQLTTPNTDQKNKKSKTIEFNNLIEDCYELDDNEIPARFKLKYLDKLFPGLDQKDPAFGKLWQNVESKLGHLLKTAAEICFRKELINRTEYERYFVSG